LRFLHHVCSGLGAALSRIEKSDQLAAAHTLGADRDRTARDEARAANKAKDTFLAMLGHELRNPLAPIITAAELLRRNASGPELAHVEVVMRQARHLDRLVGDLLDVSRVTTGKVNLRRSAIDLRGRGRRMRRRTARPRMQAKGQRLSIDVPDFPVMVDGDEARLAQVAANLLNNASAFSPSGSRIELLVRVGVGEALLEVRDEGIGIAAGMLASIFELFVQGGAAAGVGARRTGTGSRGLARARGAARRQHLGVERWRRPR
jgi:signal transduction histidine kinase